MSLDIIMFLFKKFEGTNYVFKIKLLKKNKNNNDEKMGQAESS